MSAASCTLCFIRSTRSAKRREISSKPGTKTCQWSKCKRKRNVHHWSINPIRAHQARGGLNSVSIRQEVAINHRKKTVQTFDYPSAPNPRSYQRTPSYECRIWKLRTIMQLSQCSTPSPFKQIPPVPFLACHFRASLPGNGNSSTPGLPHCKVWIPNPYPANMNQCYGGRTIQLYSFLSLTVRSMQEHYHQLSRRISDIFALSLDHGYSPQ